MTKFNLVSSEEKIEGKVTPYVTFPIIKDCTLKCEYCGDGGEMSLCEKSMFKTEDILEWHKAARKLGVKKFRITGGEPLLHKDFRKIVETLSKDANLVLVNTNGTLLKRYKEKWIDLPQNVIFVVNYHGATEEIYNKVTCTEGYFNEVREGIELLASEDKLHRLNTVYCEDNKNYIFDIIDYCRELGVDLKIQDVVSVPWQFEEWEEIYVDTTELEKEFEKRSSYIRDHKYARGFGTPSKIYTIDGVNVTLKSVRNGSHYDLGKACKDCEYFPCHEGVYDLFVFPDGKAMACNWTEKGKAPEGTKEEKLQWLIDCFQRAEYRKASDRILKMSMK